MSFRSRKATPTGISSLIQGTVGCHLIQDLPGLQQFHQQAAQQPPQNRFSSGAEWPAVLPVRQVDHSPKFIPCEGDDHETVGVVVQPPLQSGKVAVSAQVRRAQRPFVAGYVTHDALHGNPQPHLDFRLGAHHHQPVKFPPAPDYQGKRTRG